METHCSIITQPMADIAPC